MRTMAVLHVFCGSYFPLLWWIITTVMAYHAHCLFVVDNVYYGCLFGALCWLFYTEMVDDLYCGRY